MLKRWLALLRVKQYTKNGFVAVPLLFAGKYTQETITFTVVASVAFCLLSSAVYIVNDMVDAPRDRLHPKKRHRPLASGQVSVPMAAVVAVGLLAASLVLGALLQRPLLLLVMGLYVGNSLLYSFLVKEVQLLDLFGVSLGHILRVFAGSTAIQVPVSPFLFLVTLFLTTFLAAGKRRYELIALGANAPAHKGVLRRYSVYFLDQIMLICATLTLATYILYVVDPGTIQRFGSAMVLTVPVATFGIFRYYHITHNLEGGEPSDDLVSDPFILGTGLLYFAIFVALVVWQRVL